jgi:hypothetical protein
LAEVGSFGDHRAAESAWWHDTLECRKSVKGVPGSLVGDGPTDPDEG